VSANPKLGYGKISTYKYFLDQYHPKADSKCAISIRITFNRQKIYYSTKYKLTIEVIKSLFVEKPTKPKK